MRAGPGPLAGKVGCGVPAPGQRGGGVRSVWVPVPAQAPPGPMLPEKHVPFTSNLRKHLSIVTRNKPVRLLIFT